MAVLSEGQFIEAITDSMRKGSASLQRRLQAAGEFPDYRSWGFGSPPKRNLVTPAEHTSSTVARSAKAASARQLARKHIAPIGPGLAPIKALHRHSDGIVCLAVNSAEHGWRPVRGIKASALDSIFPEFASQLLQDSLVSLNASFSTLGQQPYRQQGYPMHRLDTLRYLNAVFVDLDYPDFSDDEGNELTRPKVIAEIERLEYEGIVPPSTMKVDTGHGMWVLWMLHQPGQRSQSHRLVQDIELQTYAKINGALRGIFAHLGADSKPSAATHIRMDGSFRPEYDSYVRWDLSGESSTPYTYELLELAEFFDVKVTPRLPEEVRSAFQASGRTTAPSKAWIATNENRLTVVRTMLDARGGGFDRGCRNHGAYLYALALRGVKTAFARAEAQVIAMGRDCRPPLSEGDCCAAVEQAWRPRLEFNRANPRSIMLSYQCIADSLAVSPDEAQIVSQAIGGKAFPAGVQFGPTVLMRDGNGKETLQARIARLKAAILEIVTERQVSHPGDPVPSSRLMSKLILEKYGIDVAHNTIGKHYPELGYETKRQKNLSAAESRRHAHRQLFSEAS